MKNKYKSKLEVPIVCYTRSCVLENDILQSRFLFCSFPINYFYILSDTISIKKQGLAAGAFRTSHQVRPVRFSKTHQVCGAFMWLVGTHHTSAFLKKHPERNIKCKVRWLTFIDKENVENNVTKTLLGHRNLILHF